MIAVGVPSIVPVAWSMDSPAGNSGFIEKVTIGPPFAVGVTVFMGVPNVSTKELGV